VFGIDGLTPSHAAAETHNDNIWPGVARFLRVFGECHLRREGESSSAGHSGLEEASAGKNETAHMSDVENTRFGPSRLHFYLFR
jgi:hypothetical protein